MAVAVALSLASGYLSGSLPWGLWLGLRVRGIDVRTVGSHNLGATNVYRSLGPGLGIATLVLDLAKGALPVLLVPGGSALAAFPGGREWCAVAVGLAAVAGHVWTCFASFRGGAIVDAVSNVMNAFTLRLEILGDGRVGPDRGEELDVGLGHLQERLFDTVDTARASVRIMAAMLVHTAPNEAACAAAGYR